MKKRSRRDQRQTNIPNMRFTKRDLNILKAVYEYRVLNTSHLKTLFFPSFDQTYMRLALLYNHGFLDRKFTGVYLDKMNTPVLYVLDRRGAEALHDAGILIKGWKGKSKQVGIFFLQHTLEINTIRIAVLKACDQLGFELVEWRSENELKDSYDHVKLPEIEQPTAVLPDSYFAIKTSTGITHFFLEVDRSTETNGIFKRKLAAYQIYCGSPLAKKRFGTTKFRVLTVTKSAARLENLKWIAERIAGKNRFWFTTLAQVTQNSVLNAAIWQVAGRDDAATLLY